VENLALNRFVTGVVCFLILQRSDLHRNSVTFFVLRRIATMLFWSDKLSSYEAVHSNGGEGPRLRLEKHGVSRCALIAFILITQILVLASTNLAAYTWGRTLLVESLTSAPRMSNSESFGGPQGASADCHHKTVSC
jgi:hypothetical protein